MTYLDGQGVLRRVLAESTQRNFSVGEVSVEQHGDEHGARSVSVWLNVRGTGSVNDLIAALADLDGVLTVAGDDANDLTL